MLRAHREWYAFRLREAVPNPFIRSGGPIMRLRPLLASLMFAAVIVSSVADAQQNRPAGHWDCQSSLGPAVLDFQNAQTLTYGGVAMPYRVSGNTIQVVQDGYPVDYLFAMQNDRMDIRTPEGEIIQCMKSNGAGRSAVAAPGAAGAGQWNHLLQGQLCSWSGSSSGGNSRSTTQRAFFDGRGRFTTGSESSTSVTSRDSGGNEVGTASAYGSGEGVGGTYEVTAATPGAPIRVRWNTGEADVAYVHHVSGGRITEVKYGKLLFGMGLCE